MTRCHHLGLLLLGACLYATTVAAGPAPPSVKTTVARKPALTLFMLGQGGTFTVEVASGVMTFIDFPGQLGDPLEPYWHPYFNIERVGKNTLRVVPLPDAPEGHIARVHVEFVVNQANFEFVIGAPESAVEFLHVRVGSLEDLREIATEIAEPQITEANKRADEADKRADEANKRADEANKRADEAEDENVYVQARGLLDQLDGFPPCRMPLLPVQEAQRSKAASRTNLTLLQSCWDDKKIHLLVPFEIDNHDPAPFQPGQLEVRGTDAKVYPARVVLPRPKKAGADGVLPRVGPRERIRGVLSIDLSGSQAADKLVIRFSEAGTQHPGRWVAATITAYSFMRAVVIAAPADDWEREILAREAREARGKQIILGPRVSYGGCWLADAPGSNNLDSTGCTMVGVSLVKGITEMFAVDVEGLGGWTNGGDTSAKLGRVTASGLLRFGQWTIPYLRVGIGGQVASVDGSSEFGGLLAAGGGVDRRLGENVLIGIGVYYASALQDENRFRQSLGIGAHISVGWNRHAEAAPRVSR